MFEGFGEIISTHVLKSDGTDPLSNTGFVCFKNSESALEAIKQLNR